MLLRGEALELREQRRGRPPVGELRELEEHGIPLGKAGARRRERRVKGEALGRRAGRRGRRGGEPQARGLGDPELPRVAALRHARRLRVDAPEIVERTRRAIERAEPGGLHLDHGARGRAVGIILLARPVTGVLPAPRGDGLVRGELAQDLALRGRERIADERAGARLAHELGHVGGVGLAAVAPRDAQDELVFLRAREGGRGLHRLDKGERGRVHVVVLRPGPIPGGKGARDLRQRARHGGGERRGGRPGEKERVA